MEIQASSDKSQMQSQMSWEAWQRLMGSDSFLLLRQALTGFRWQQMEQLLVVGSDQLKAAEVRGRIQTVDLILTGGMDESVRKLLDLPAFVPKPPADYIAHLTYTDTQPDEEQGNH